MPRVEVDYTELDLTCGDCGTSLSVEDDGSIYPCERCLDTFRDSGWGEGYELGYENGYEVGFEEGKQEAYEERSNFNTLIRRGSERPEVPEDAAIDMDLFR